MTEQGSWRSYRIGKALLWGGFILYLPCVLILSFAFEALGMPGDLVAVGAFAWMALWVVNGLLWAKFSCPNCSNCFFIRGPLGIGNLWDFRCGHCGAVRESGAS